MYSYKINHLPKRTCEITIHIPIADIKKEQEIAFDKIRQNLEVAGFRKGKVPKEVAKKHISQQLIYEEIIKSLIPRLYDEVVKKENLTPIISPRIDLVKAKATEDWEIKITIAQPPQVTLPAYKEIIKSIKSELKKTNIWVPGKDTAGSEKQNEEENKHQLLNKILERLLLESKLEISDLVIEDELNRRLTNLLDDIKKIGLTVEAYLKSKNITIEDLKKNLTQEIEDTYKLEFILMEIAEKEGIQVEKEDLDKLFTNITDDHQRKKAEENAYFYASILRKQKTIDFLLTL